MGCVIFPLARHETYPVETRHRNTPSRPHGLDSSTYYVQERPAQNFVRGAGLIGQGGSFARPAFFFLKRHRNTRRSRVTAHADLDPPKGLGLGLGLGSGLGLG